MTLQNVDHTLAVLNGGGTVVSRAGRLLTNAGGRLLSRYGALVGFVLLWQLASVNHWVNASIFPPLNKIAEAFWSGLTQGSLLADIGISLQRAGLAFLAAIAVAIPLGLFMGQIRALERALDPILQFFRQTSALALYPVFILLLGLGELSKVFVIFWATIFPLLLSTIGGVKEVDAKLIEMAKVYGASRLQIFRRVVLPGALVSIFVGLRLSATMALLMLIASEMIGANQGLGFQVMNAQFNFQIPLMFAAIFLLAAFGLAANYSIVLLQRSLCRWSDASV